MRPIQLPEPPSPTFSSRPEDIFESGVHGVIRRAVVISNGFPGSEDQAVGLVRALGFSDNKHALYRVTRPKGGINEWLHWLPVSLHKTVDYFIQQILVYYSKRLLSSNRTKFIPIPSEDNGKVGLSQVLEADANQIIKLARETYEKDGPLLVVASGRDTISISSSIRRLASENVFVVQIKHPRVHLNRFDLVITPHHDYFPLTSRGQEQVPHLLRRWITPREPPDNHVVLTVGALHQIDSTVLRSAASAWHEEFAPLPKPLLVINIGGPSRSCRYGVDLAKQLSTAVLSVLASCGSVRISFSDRSPQKVCNVIIKELGNNPKIIILDGEEPNPHMGLLAWADAFVVTADSVSMISEACSTGKPVYVTGAERCKWKLSEFHRSLRERGVVRPFTGFEDISDSWSYPPLNDTAEAARRVHEALAQRGWRLKP